MSAVPYMKFYIGDYLGDTQHLTTLQHGAYLLLIMAYWQRRGPLPMDDEKLSRIARCAIAEWMQCKSDILAFFDERDGLLYHKRIDRELEGVKDVSEQRSKAAHKKWDSIPKTDAIALQMDSNCNAKGMLSHIHIPYSDSYSNIEPEKENIPFISVIDPIIKNDTGSRISKVIESWNELGLLPRYALTSLTMFPQERADCMRIMTAFTDEQTIEAMETYLAIKQSAEHEPPIYQSMPGFMKSGVAKFVKESNPWELFKKRKGFETAEERDDRRRAEIRIQLGVDDDT
jgi:uncharacterized protein YdaU (DUF1376 family)